ncbi:MAG: esterase/lipase family protein [Nitrososphaeraceae archaeon]
MIISSSSNSSSKDFYRIIEMGYSQSSTNDNNTNAVTNINSTKLPVLLIHGYMADATVWNKWVDLLKKENISAFPITFKQSDDECGSAAQHAKELSKIIGQIKDKTGQNKVNIVGHSKGGLDARVYLANNTKDVANLIMIGTPNAGSPLAESSEDCKPAVYDLRPGAAATQVNRNPNTKYYTIASDWNAEEGNCKITSFLPMEEAGFSKLPKPNDGMVPLSSVESQDYFINLGHSKSCHSNLMSEYEYGLAKEIINVDVSKNQTDSQQLQQQQRNQTSGMSLDLTTPTADNLYGGDKKGSFDLDFNNSTVSGIAKMNEPPAKGKAYEGWFEDKGDQSSYRLSVGQFSGDNNSTLAINQTMVNPYTYTVFYVTAEPVKDLDPRPSDIVVATKLPLPFGQ